MKLKFSNFSRIGWASIITFGVLVTGTHCLYADAGPAIARVPQDAQSRLIATRSNLSNILTHLKSLQSGNFGGYVEQATSDTNEALAAVIAATAYIKDHPEANRLLTSSQITPDTIAQIQNITPPGTRGQLYGSENYLNMANVQVTNAIRNLQNVQARGARSGATASFLGDLDGNRAKIVAALAKVNQDLINAYNYSNNPLEVPSAAGAAALGKYQGKVTVELADNDGPTVIEIPKTLLDGTAPAATPAAPLTAASIGGSSPDASNGQSAIASNDTTAEPTANSSPDDLPMRALLPSVIASVAMSGAFILGGLYFFSRQQRKSFGIPATVSMVVGALVIGLCLAHAATFSPATTSQSASNLAPPPPPPPLPYSSPVTTTNPRSVVVPSGQNLGGVGTIPATPAPHFSGDAVVYMVTTGDSVHIILSRKNAADLLGQPPAR